MKKTALLLIFIFSTVNLTAHPHVFIDLYIGFELDDDGITGFWEDWMILDTFGKSICTEYDKDSDGSFNADETAAVKHDLFDNIIRYNYYTYLDIEGTIYFPTGITDFSVRKAEDAAVFRFFVPCRLPPQNRSLKLTMHDLSKYVSFGLRYIDDPINSDISYRVNIERDDEFYSHTNMFGNAVLKIDIQSDAPPGPAPPELTELSPLNESPRETATNPFIKKGVRIKDDNPNPFMTY